MFAVDALCRNDGNSLQWRRRGHAASTSKCLYRPCDAFKITWTNRTGRQPLKPPNDQEHSDLQTQRQNIPASKASLPTFNGEPPDAIQISIAFTGSQPRARPCPHRSAPEGVDCARCEGERRPCQRPGGQVVVRHPVLNKARNGLRERSDNGL
jgi:hypothetical protein